MSSRVNAWFGVIIPNLLAIFIVLFWVAVPIAVPFMTIHLDVYSLLNRGIGDHLEVELDDGEIRVVADQSKSCCCRNI